MSFPTLRRRTLAAVVLALTTSAVVAPAFAQSDDSDQGRFAEARKKRAQKQKQAAQAAEQAPAASASSKYPNATRSVAAGKASVKGTPKLQAMLKSFNDGNVAEARTA